MAVYLLANLLERLGWNRDACCEIQTTHITYREKEPVSFRQGSPVNVTISVLGDSPGYLR